MSPPRIFSFEFSEIFRTALHIRTLCNRRSFCETKYDCLSYDSVTYFDCITEYQSIYKKYYIMFSREKRVSKDKLNLSRLAHQKTLAKHVKFLLTSLQTVSKKC